MENQIVPLQIRGSQMDVVAETSFDTLAAAMVFFEVAKSRLADVSNWAQICGTNATTFELLNPAGTAAGTLEEGHLIKIDIPGPGTKAGEGYDWVRVAQVSSWDEVSRTYFGFRVHPCPNPSQPEKGTAHFFKDSASSTFLVKLFGNTVSAEMHGRNEEPNTQDPDFLDSVRNTAVGYGAKVGLAFPQWKLLVEGLVNTDGHAITSRS